MNIVKVMEEYIIYLPSLKNEQVMFYEEDNGDITIRPYNSE